MPDKERIYEYLNRLVAVPSISGTEDEVLAADKIYELISEIPYFSLNRDNLMRIPIEGDPFNRVLVAAFLESADKSEDTVILTGHYDVVDVEEFGVLKDIAFDMEAVTERIIELPLSDEVRKDYESGEYYFGRGTLDMKYGHAASIELLRYYSENMKLKGNLLYVAVCGEETNSEGMLAAVPFFTEFAEKHNLKYRCLLLMEGYLLDGQKEGIKYIQYGNAGKVMPMFLCVGKMTHGEEPLLGLDANLLSGEVYRLMAENPLFCQKNHGISTSLPCGLKQQDMKENYSLSTTLYAASYYNIATISLDPKDLMNKLTGVAEQAFENTKALIEDKVRGFEAFAGRTPEYYMPETCVMTFSELYKGLETEYDGDLEAHVKEMLELYMKENPEMQDASVRLVRHLAEMYSDKRPKIIVSIIPPYYPDVNLDCEDEDTVRMMNCIEDVIGYASDKYGVTIESSEYYGISDMCYTWLADGLDFDTLFDNLVGINTMYMFPTEELKKFKVPGMVLGCAGKDMHKYTERLEKDYNFNVLPELYTYVIEKLIG